MTGLSQNTQCSIELPPHPHKGIIFLIFSHLFQFEDVFHEELLKIFVCIVDAQLLETEKKKSIERQKGQLEEFHVKNFVL